MRTPRRGNRSCGKMMVEANADKSSDDYLVAVFGPLEDVHPEEWQTYINDYGPEETPMSVW